MRNRLILIALILGLATFAYFTGLYQYLAPDRLREFLTEAGLWGPVIIVVLFALLEPFGTPGAVFILAAATLWPFWLALTVNWIGATGAGMIGFAFARYFGRDWVEGRMPERLRKWDERLSHKGLSAVVLFRLFFFLNPASHWALGLSRVPASTAFFGTVIGFGPPIVLWTYFGSQILDWFKAQTAATWIPIGVAIAAFIAYRHFRKKNAEPDPEAVTE